MADLPEQNEWTPGIYQLETSDPVLGGPEGVSNKSAKQLANRTSWLKNQIEKIVKGLTTIGKAAQLETARTFRFKGDATGSGRYDGSADTNITLTLTDSGITPGTYTKLTFNSKGIATTGAALTAADLPNLSWSKITSGKPTTLSGYGIDIATQPEAEARHGQNNTKPMTPLRVFQAITKRVVQATEAVMGVAKVATQAQMNTGAGDDVIVTPYKLRLGFAVSFSATGYVVFPFWLGHLIIQWTNSAAIAPGATGAGYWPIAFPNGCIWALAAPLGNSGNFGAGNVVAGGVSSVAVNLYNWGVINSPARILAIGV